MDDDTQVEPTIEERLAALEKQVVVLKVELPRLFWFVVAIFIAVLVLFLVFVWSAPRSSDPAPSNHDASLQELMTKRVHCYDSVQERGAARQRVLAEIDRAEWADKWEAAHPPVGAYPPFGLDGPPPVIEPSVWDTPMAGASWDATRCFEIK